jgi:excisionase family DNA binding protein
MDTGHLRYLTVDQAAHLSGLHANSLRRAVRRGTLRGCKMLVGGHRRVMIARNDLRAYADPIEGELALGFGPKGFIRRQTWDGNAR